MFSSTMHKSADLLECTAPLGVVSVAVRLVAGAVGSIAIRGSPGAL